VQPWKLFSILMGLSSSLLNWIYSTLELPAILNSSIYLNWDKSIISEVWSLYVIDVNPVVDKSSLSKVSVIFPVIVNFVKLLHSEITNSFIDYPETITDVNLGQLLM
jgi:hypothetical protein